MRTAKWAICPLCGIEENLTIHHTLWPGRKPNSKYYNHPLREQLKILICEECHKVIHDYYRVMNADETRYNGKENKRVS